MKPAEADASSDPSCEKTIEFTQNFVATELPYLLTSAQSQIQMVQSWEADASNELSCDKATAVTDFVWLSISRTSSSDFGFQILIVVSAEVDASSDCVHPIRVAFQLRDLLTYF